MEVRYRTVDFVAAPDPNECLAAGVIPCPYTGSARPPQAWFAACRSLGIAPLWMIQETVSERSQAGWQAGADDCRYAEARAREVGHTGPLAVVVSDGDSADAWDSSGFGGGWASVATLGFFAYGAHGVIGPFEAGAASSPLLIRGGWVPSTWGQGLVAAQLVGAQAALSTPHDLNAVYYDFGGSDPMDYTAQLNRIEQDLIGPNTGGTPGQGSLMEQVGRTAVMLGVTGEGGVETMEQMLRRVLAQPSGIDVEAVVGKVKAAYDSAPNSDEWPTIERALRGALPA